MTILANFDRFKIINRLLSEKMTKKEPQLTHFYHNPKVTSRKSTQDSLISEL